MAVRHPPGPQVREFVAKVYAPVIITAAPPVFPSDAQGPADRDGYGG